jgi:D-alanyl-D-alanine carboxypeptidase
LEQPVLASVVASRSAVIPFPIKGGKLWLYNNNPLLLARYPGADGVKTGYTQAAGPCLIATARRGRAWLGVVLLHSANPALQARKLLDAGFAKLRVR